MALSVVLPSPYLMLIAWTDASPGKLRFQQYNHDIRAGTIQTVYVYPLSITHSTNFGATRESDVNAVL